MKYDQPQAHDIHELLDKLVVVVEIVFIFNFFLFVFIYIKNKILLIRFATMQIYF